MSGIAHVSDEQRLLYDLFLNYHDVARPVRNATRPVVVEFAFTLVQIIDVDERNQILTTNVWLESNWKEERLIWNPTDYGNIKKLCIPAQKLWLPDIVLYNNAEDYNRGYMPINAMVRKNGNVFWAPPAKFKSSCHVDITYFPFDNQRCSLRFGSWAYTQAQLDIQTRKIEKSSNDYVTNGEWHLVKTYIKRYHSDTTNQVFIDFVLVIKRRTLYYWLNVIFPCIWLNFLNLLCFVLPPESGEKVTLSVTVLLSYSVFMLLVAEMMPSTMKYVPLVGVYLTASMALTTLSICLTILIVKQYYHAQYGCLIRRPHYIIRSVINCHLFDKETYFMSPM
ncbi:hypothetical protein SNEBB_000153, partial [Seison nebaliae]